MRRGARSRYPAAEAPAGSDGNTGDSGSRSNGAAAWSARRCIALAGAAALLLLPEPARPVAPDAQPGCAVEARILLHQEDGAIALDRSVADSRMLRLAGVEVVRAHPPERDAAADAGGADLPAMAAAAQQLIASFTGQELCLQEVAAPDRYGRLPAHLFARDGRWLQGELLSRGLARVRTTPDTAARVAEMLALEDQARNAQRGLWRMPEYRVLPPEDAGRGIGRFALIEGEVVSAVRRKNNWYLNFGPDWRTDFTVAIPVRSLPAGALAALDPHALQGTRVRVRGWVDTYNGPLIALTHAEQIERLNRPEQPASR